MIKYTKDAIYVDKEDIEEIKSMMCVSVEELTPEQRRMLEEEMKEEAEDGEVAMPLFVNPQALEFQYHYKHDKKNWLIDGKEYELTEQELDRFLEADYTKYLEEEAPPQPKRLNSATPICDGIELSKVFQKEKRAKDYIYEAIKEQGYGAYKDLYKAAGVTASSFNRARDGHGSKATLLAIGLTLGFDNEKLQKFLLSDGYVLSPYLVWDKAILYCLSHGISNVDSINIFLYEHDLATLTEAGQNPALCKNE